MLELSSHEVVCPVCKSGFFPETSAKREILCGENLYAHTQKSARKLGCKIYYFCSDNCISEFQSNNRQSERISRWMLLLERISRANMAHGIRGSRHHDLYLAKKSS